MSGSTGIGLQPDYGLQNGQRNESPSGACGAGSGNTGTIFYKSLGNNEVVSGPSALSKLQTLQSWLDQFPTAARGLYLTYAARDPSITNLVNLSNQEISCLAQGVSCTFCYPSLSPSDLNQLNSLKETLQACPCKAGSTTKVPADLVSLAKEILAIRSTAMTPSSGICPAREGPSAVDEGCENLKAFEWTTKTGLPLGSSDDQSNDNPVNGRCATTLVPSQEACANFVQTVYNGSWSTMCSKVNYPSSVDSFSQAICETLVATGSLKPESCDDPTSLSDPYCQCLNSTKVATYNAQASAAKCCYHAPTPSTPSTPAKTSSKTWIIVGVIGTIVLIIILAVAIPMGIKSKHRKAARMAAIAAHHTGSQGLSPPGSQGLSPSGSPMGPSYASPNPLVTNTSYAPDQESSILPPPTTL